MSYHKPAFRRVPALIALSTALAAGAAYAGSGSNAAAPADTRVQSAADPLQQRANESMPKSSVASPDMPRVLPVAGDPMQSRANQAASRDAVTQSDLPHASGQPSPASTAEQAPTMKLPADAVRSTTSLDRNGDHLVSPEEMEQALGVSSSKTAAVKP
jgi:hypothetical protein